jgi:hypothetical protein
MKSRSAASNSKLGREASLSSAWAGSVMSGASTSMTVLSRVRDWMPSFTPLAGSEGTVYVSRVIVQNSYSHTIKVTLKKM